MAPFRQRDRTAGPAGHAREGDDFADRLAARGVPFVLALRTDGRSLASVGDDRLGGYLAARHLLDLGHRRIGVIAGPSYASSSRGRVQGYRDALAEAGISVDPLLLVPSSFGIDAGAEAAEVLMRLDPAPTAIFAVNDNTAIGALSGLHRTGLSVPEDVSLVGYNDIPIVSRLIVPLTTVRVPFDQIAVAALELLRFGAHPYARPYSYCKSHTDPAQIDGLSSRAVTIRAKTARCELARLEAKLALSRSGGGSPQC